MRHLVLTLLALLYVAGPARSEGPTVLATGDSMMRGVDRRLEDELARLGQVSFVSDVQIGSTVTTDHWVRRARRQARRHLPSATVVFIGANDGFDMPGARCCRRPWVHKYEDRVRNMIRAYSREGLGDVFWVTLPAARSGRRRRIFPKINRAIRRAVRSKPVHAHLVDAWDVFTPAGRYRRTMLWKGTRVEVRSPDGVHLRSSGPSIAAELIRQAMVTRADVPPPPP